MANKRIKDLTQTATTLASDDYVAIDGSSNGTRKIVKSDLVNDISSQVAGTYLDEANNLSDVASKDTSKLNLEVPDVGTAPNEVPLNGMLGSMAYQSSESVAVGRLDVDGKTTLNNDSDNALVVETTNQNPMYVNVVGSAPNYLFDVRDDDTSKFRVDGSGNVKLSGDENELQFHSDTGVGDNVRARIQCEGKTGTYGYGGDLVFKTTADNNTSAERVRIDSGGRLGVNQTSPSTNANSIADDLVVGNTGQASGITVVGGTGSTSAMVFGAGGTTIKGGMVYDHPSNSLNFSSNGATRWLLNSSGNLQANGAYGIDFGSTTTGTGTPSGGLLSDYEEGSFVPSLQFGGASTGITYSSQYGYYTKIGRLVTVHYHIALTSRGTSTGAAKIVGGPFVSANNAGGKDVTVLYPYAMASLNSTPFATHDQNSNTLSLYDTVAGGRDPLTEANFSNSAGINCTVTFEV